MKLMKIKVDRLGTRNIHEQDAEFDKNNQKLMSAIKKMHSVVENVDFDKQRHSQDNFGSLFGASPSIEFEQIQIGTIEAEWIRLKHAQSSKRMILYCHGGGYATGSCRYARSVTAKLTAATGIPIVAFNYRLAPEHPFPAAIEDVMLVWDYFMREGVGAENVIVTGDSAGGNLALELLLNLKKQKRRFPKALVLFSPWTDMTSSGASHQEKAQLDPVLEKNYLDRMIECYAGEHDLNDEELSPLFADFTGFPPVYIQVGSNEILLDDSRRLCKKLLKDKVLARLDQYDGMWHVFQMAPFKRSYDAIKDAADFIFEICR